MFLSQYSSMRRQEVFSLSQPGTWKITDVLLNEKGSNTKWEINWFHLRRVLFVFDILDVSMSWF